MAFVEIHLRTARWGPSRGEGVAGEGALGGVWGAPAPHQPGRPEHAGCGVGVGGLGRHQEVDARGPAWLSRDRAGRRLWGLGFSQPRGLAAGGGRCPPAQELRHPQRQELVRRRNKPGSSSLFFQCQDPCGASRRAAPALLGLGTPQHLCSRDPSPNSPCPHVPCLPTHGSRLGDAGRGPCVALPPSPGTPGAWSWFTAEARGAVHLVSKSFAVHTTRRGAGGAPGSGAVVARASMAAGTARGPRASPPRPRPSSPRSGRPGVG